MSASTFHGAYRAKQKLERQLHVPQLWLVIAVDIVTGELTTLDYRESEQGLEASGSAWKSIKSRVENFIAKLDRELLTVTGAESLADFYHEADNYIDTLRDAEGRVFL
ncbi:hypothetical protein RPD76_07650 [Methylomonas sp. MV1]|uniref:hypothetical protein n=1 Tax=Methylomonas sp. MV1 TaxID=3073620 RepID=UPI0028A5656A|nr:hypothetical protein [Methylomonas sp. MV1]MDT4329780.1 hypothetical protein [Methylomonas sp. MV1]